MLGSHDLRQILMNVRREQQADEMIKRINARMQIQDEQVHS